MADAVSMQLRSGAVARLTSDGFVAGALTLSLDGVAQSHIDLRDPRHLFYDYVRRMGTAIDLAAPHSEPLAVLHLGGGALTLARYVAETRPGSTQLVVEVERGLVPFMLEEAPLPRSATVTLIEDDALAALRSLGAADTADDAWVGRADVVVCDVYAGLETPGHLVTDAFFEAVARVLSPRGVVLVNVADEADLRRCRVQLAALTGVFPCVAMIGPPAIIDGLDGPIGLGGDPAARPEGRIADAVEAGNIVLLAGQTPAILERMPALAAAGPHPVAWRVVSGG